MNSSCPPTNRTGAVSDQRAHDIHKAVLGVVVHAHFCTDTSHDRRNARVMRVGHSREQVMLDLVIHAAHQPIRDAVADTECASPQSTASEVSRYIASAEARVSGIA